MKAKTKSSEMGYKKPFIKVVKRCKYASVEYDVETFGRLNEKGVDALNAFIKPYVLNGSITNEDSAGRQTWWGNGWGNFIVYREAAVENEKEKTLDDRDRKLRRVMGVVNGND